MNTNGGWFRVENRFLDSAADLTHLAFRVYVVLTRFADNDSGTCFPSISKIAELCGLSSRRRVRAAVRELVERQLIALRPRTDTSGRHSSHEYQILTPNEWPSGGSEDAPAMGTKPDPGGGAQRDQGWGPEGTGGGVQKGPQKRLNEKDALKKTSRRALRYDAEDMAVARWMLDRLLELKPDFKQPDLSKWANDIRLMRQGDGRAHADIRELFDRATQDNFWRSNVLSPGGLRRHWDQLDLKLRGPRNGKPRHAANGPDPTRPRNADSSPYADRYWAGDDSAGAPARPGVAQGNSANGQC